jgi:hypothetical protein
MSPVTEIARVFTDAKTVDSRALNLAGAQPFRSVLARFLYNLRRGSHDPMIAELSRTGIIVCEDFLHPVAFTAVEREVEGYMSESSPKILHKDGTTEVRHFSLATVDSERFPHLEQWRGHRQVMALASAAERRNCRRGDGSSLVEHLSVGDYSQPDSQTELHLDTFFHTHKIWLYLDDVSTENAAFVYVPGSHLLDRVRLRHDYLESTSTNGASRRVSEDEVRSRGLERRIVSCPRNTLVVANTCGYHCRSVGEAGASRRALHKAFRFNPFSPMTWTPSRLKGSAVRWTGRSASRWVGP